MDRKIVKITHNWRQVEGGEDYDSYTVGNYSVVEITEHRPAGEGDKFFYDVQLKDGSIIRLFNPNTVLLNKPGV